MEMLQYFFSHSDYSIQNNENNHTIKPSVKDSIILADELLRYSRSPQQNIKKLSELEVATIITVLEDAFHQLSVVGCPDLKLIEKMKDPLYKTIEERVYTVKYEKDEVPLIDCKSNLYHELKENCIFLLQTIQYTIYELLSCGSYESLQNYVMTPFITCMEELELLEEMKSNVLRIQILEKELEIYAQKIKSEIESEKCHLLRKKGYFARLREFYGKEKDYVEKWETARRSQNTLRLSKSEIAATKLMQSYQKNLLLETFAHECIIHYIKKESTVLRFKHKEYEYRREYDLETIDWKYDVVLLKFKHISAEKEDNAEGMKLLQKHLKRVERIKVRDDAARAIQDWWRTKREDELKEKEKEEKSKLKISKKKEKISKRRKSRRTISRLK